jgi:hypothetical protein
VDDPASIAALPLPPGVKPEVWHELTSALAQQVAARQTSAAQPPQLPRPSELTYDPATHEVTWAYELAGDYDQDGVVTLADLVPLAQHFGEVAPNPYNQPQPAFDYWSIQAVIDGDRDGVIGLSDLTVLGKNLGARVDGYSLYASRSFSDYPLAEVPMTLPAEVIWAADFEYDRSYMTPANASPASCRAADVPADDAQLRSGLGGAMDPGGGRGDRACPRCSRYPITPSARRRTMGLATMPSRNTSAGISPCVVTWISMRRSIFPM